MKDFQSALVTGGAGFIGHHLVGALLERGLAVTVLDDLSVGRREKVPSAARFVRGDVRDEPAVREALEGVDCVFHLAAVVSVRASMERYVEDADVNYLGTLSLLRQLPESRVRRAILASSMAVYAESPGSSALSESAPTEPISPYGISKLAAEKAWRLLCARAGVPATVLRYFNTYGPGQTPTPYVGVITIFIERLLAGQAPVIFGDGEQKRDFVHVSDVVGASLAALDDGQPGGVYNVGTGRATSVNEVAASLAQLIAPGVAALHAPAVPGEMRHAVADISALRSALGFSPRRIELDLRDVVAARRSQ